MNPSDEHPEAVAIIGMSGRFPGARTLAEFWQNIRDGAESITFFSDEELQATPLDGAPQLDHPQLVKARGLIDRPEWFDAAFFGVNPKQADLIDPQHRVLLEIAWEALEDAGCNPESFPGLIGVFAGASFNSYLLANILPNREEFERAGGFQTQLASDKDFLTTRISYKLNLRGPSLDVQTACSTSLVTVALACQQLLGYQCDLALAGGVSIAFPQKRAGLHQEGGILSPDGHCRPFDEAAAGTVWGDGAGLVVLKRLSEALADGDPIRAVIRGTAINNDGAGKIGYTAPGIDGQAAVIAQAQACAGVSPGDISYVEAHGTATPLGDPIEVAALTKAFATENGPRAYCALGTVKGNVGHLDTAAGIAGLIKTVLALQHRQIPPTVHFKSPNPRLELAGGPFYIADQLRDWEVANGPRRAGVSSFGIGGTNAHVVLEEAAPIAPSMSDGRTQLLVLSARSPAALDAATRRLIAHLEAEPDLNLADVAWTLQTGRKAFSHRRSVAAHDVPAAIAALRRALESPGVRSAGASVPVAFLFPGQGAQQVNMMLDTYRNEPVFRERVNHCCDLLQPLLGVDLRTLLYPSDDSRDLAALQLEQTAFTQPALFVVEYALARLWMSWGVQPRAMVGHSLGEYVAACIAGVFSLETGLRLVTTRARLMQKMEPGAMLAVMLSELEVQEFLGDPRLALAAVNAPRLCVISGPTEAISALEKSLAARPVECRRLATSHAFHSSMMDSMLADFRNELGRANLHPPQIPYVSNVTGRWITEQEATSADYWTAHVRQTVRFADGVAELCRESQPVLLQVGPGHTLCQLARQHPTAANATVISSYGRPDKRVENGSALLSALGEIWSAGVRIDWAGVHEEQPRRRIPLPTYPFERKRHWIEPTRSPGPVRASASPFPSSSTPPFPSGSAAPFATSAAGRPNLPASTSPDTSPSIQKQLTALFQELSGVDMSGERNSLSFLRLGFDSLFLAGATQAVKQRFGVNLTFRELLENLNTIEKLAAHLEGQAGPASGASSPEEPPSSPDAPVVTEKSFRTVPLTDAQREIWFAAQLDAAVSAAYHESCTIRLRGRIDESLFREALQRLVDRHDALRITFHSSGEAQEIADHATAALEFTDLSSEPRAAASARIPELSQSDIRKPFDLQRGPLWRVRLVRITPDEHAFILVVHHLICDGWSLHRLTSELGQIYTNLWTGAPAELESGESFAEYADALARQTQNEEAEAYWMGEYADGIPSLELPGDRERPLVRTFECGHQRRWLGTQAAAAVRRLGAAHGCTPFTVLLATFNALLHRWSGQDDIAVGVPAAAQVLDGRETLVGHCIHLLPLRSRLSEDQSFGEFLHQTRRGMHEACDHWQLPFSALLRKLNVPRQANRVPLTNVTFNLDRRRGDLRYGAAGTDYACNPKAAVNFDLNFNVSESDEGFVIDCNYSSELFNASTMARALERFEVLLLAAAEDLARPVHHLPLLTANERWTVLEDFNHTHASHPGLCVHDLFESQVERTPEATAVIFGSERWSYRRLNQLANQIGNRLQRLGVRPDSIVGVAAGRTPRAIAAMLGVLKAGGAYLALDPMIPSERLSFMLRDSGAVALVTQGAFAASLADASALAVLDLTEDVPALIMERPSKPIALSRPDHLAYVIYTSGSTGQPKGVAIEHRNTVSLLHWARSQYSPEELRGVLAATSFGFDLSVFEIFAPLSTGGSLILADNILHLPSLDARHEVTLINTVPSAMAELLRLQAVPESVCTINLAGEALSAALADQVLALSHVTALYDLYGPTEDTTYSTCARRTQGGPETIGRPIANTRVYLLDRHLEPVPPGSPGELCLAGEGVARGYLHAPALTREKFVPDPFSDSPEARLYRTGDLARHRPDGSLEFLGRIDDQLKIRGYRVEPGDIEAAMSQHPGVRECVVVLREDTPGDPRLAAYFVPGEAAAPGHAELRQHLARVLPEYMVPSVFVPLERLPVSASGKRDRRNLPAPGPGAVPAHADLTPRTTTEQLVADIWCEVLGLPRVGVHDNFFELGGHSLLVGQVLTRVSQAFELDLSLRRVFDAPTVATLARVIEDALIANAPLPPGSARSSTQPDLVSAK